MSKATVILLAAVLASACSGGSGRGGTTADNQRPLASAAADAWAEEGSSVALDGSASVDPDGDIVRFLWRQTSGTAVTMAHADTPAATFRAPQVTAQVQLGFELQVTDDAGASSRDRVDVLVIPRRHSISGTILAAPGTGMDVDVNDWDAPRGHNDQPADAQSVAAGVAVGGYAAVPGAGAAGPLHSAGDVSDFYRVELSRGQTMSLLVADPAEGDLDLFLWSAEGDRLIDGAMGDGVLEILRAGAGGEHLVEVAAHRGASNYTLLFGEGESRAAKHGPRLSDDFVPGELVAGSSPGGSGARSAAGAGWVMPADGGSGGPVLVRLADRDEGARAMSASDSAHDVRVAATARAEGSLKYRTLLALKDLRRSSTVAYAQPNYLAMPQSGDPLSSSQWHYPLINLGAAWELTAGDRGVTVAVIDTGVLPDHPDLAGRLSGGYDFVDRLANSGDGDGRDVDPTDPGSGESGRRGSYHGTHVAGTVAAAAGNGRGGAGVAPKVMVLPVRVLGIAGGSSYDIIQGIRYAAGLDNASGERVPPVDVINLSLGRLGDCWPAEQAAFDAARAAGVLVVAAAGNEGVDAAATFPAGCEHVVAVGAVDEHRRRTSYSNFGAAVDVMAPGGRSGDADGDGNPDSVLSLTANDTIDPIAYGYGFKKGTSMASAHMAGVAALMRSVNPTFAPTDLDEWLAAGSLVDDAGVVDAFKAVTAALGGAGSADDGTVRLLASPRALDFGRAYGYGEIEVRAHPPQSLMLHVVQEDSRWLRLAPQSPPGSPIARYAIQIDRSGLAPGRYTQTVSVSGGGATAGVEVTMQVAHGTAADDAGHLYVLLLDARTGRVVQQTRAQAEGGSYRFAFDGVAGGAYRIVAGSDADNDLAICDAGESCGGYPFVDRQAPLLVEADASGLEFTVGRLLSVTEQPAPASGGTVRAAATERTVKRAHDG